MVQVGTSVDSICSNLGFTQSDASVYFKFDGTDITLVIVYVDNVLFMGLNPKVVKGEKGNFMKV